jgi:hypothetical protein
VEVTAKTRRRREWTVANIVPLRIVNGDWYPEDLYRKNKSLLPKRAGFRLALRLAGMTARGHVSGIQPRLSSTVCSCCAFPPASNART